jgi:hypothetical protein
MFDYPVGKVLPETEITSYASLGDLIKMYNPVAAKHGYPKLDHELVELRDALAHGKVG